MAQRWTNESSRNSWLVRSARQGVLLWAEIAFWTASRPSERSGSARWSSLWSMSWELMKRVPAMSVGIPGTTKSTTTLSNSLTSNDLHPINFVYSILISSPHFNHQWIFGGNFKHHSRWPRQLTSRSPPPLLNFHSHHHWFQPTGHLHLLSMHLMSVGAKDSYPCV